MIIIVKKIYMKRNLGKIAMMFSFSAIWLLLFLPGCKKDKTCPNGNICVQGTEITYQKSDSGMVIKLIIPPNAVENNAQLFFDDLSFQADYSTSTIWFAQSYFDIKPYDLTLLQLVKIVVEYPPAAAIDDNNNNFENDLRLYYIEDNITTKKWSIVNACQLDKEAHTVSANIIHFGQYAIAAPKSALVDEWWITPGVGNYEFAKKLILKRDGTGTENQVVDCNPAGTPDWQLTVSQFRWKVEQDSFIRRYHFNPTIICGESSGSPNDTSVVFHVDDTYLTIFDQFSLTWHRH